MQTFAIDDQTLNDLNIFRENQGSESIFSLFKRTRTMGGRERLKQMMKNPSSDPSELILRRDAIKYFHDHHIEINIRNEELDLIQFYLNTIKKKYRNNPIDLIAEYATRNSSNDFHIIKTGLKYLIQLTAYILEFIEEHSSAATPPYLKILFQKVSVIVNEDFLGNVRLYKESQFGFLKARKFHRSLGNKQRKNIIDLLEVIYELDAFTAIALSAERMGMSFPEYVTEKQTSAEEHIKVSISGLFHPAITNPVKNDVSIDKNKNITFLTGSNMAGKSSLLKSVGLSIYLAHIGFPVPAAAMETTIFKGLVTTINLPDDLNQGLSHYYSEVKRVKSVAQMLLDNDRMFVIFDELFRGTNVKDAFDASYLILSELSNISNSVFLISTHIVELASELQKFPNISFSYMKTHFENDKPVFTYEIAKGISTERLGMYIVQHEGIIEILRKASERHK